MNGDVPVNDLYAVNVVGLHTYVSYAKSLKLVISAGELHNISRSQI